MLKHIRPVFNPLTQFSFGFSSSELAVEILVELLFSLSLIAIAIFF